MTGKREGKGGFVRCAEHGLGRRTISEAKRGLHHCLSGATSGDAMLCVAWVARRMQGTGGGGAGAW